MLVSIREQPIRLSVSESGSPSGFPPELSSIATLFNPGETMEPDDMPNDVLIVEDDPIIALDFEDTILGFGVKTVRTAASVAKALDMIADRPPDFALLDVGLIREKTFAVAERLDSLNVPFVFVTGYGADVRLPAALAGKPRLTKPCSSEALEAALRRRAQVGSVDSRQDRPQPG